MDQIMMRLLIPQLVEIYLTADFGAMLVLDGYTNLAESDLPYTHTLMCHGLQVLALPSYV